MSTIIHIKCLKEARDSRIQFLRITTVMILLGVCFSNILSAQNNALLIVGDANSLSGGDLAIQNRLSINQGLTVTTISDENAGISNTIGMDVIIFTGSVSHSVVGTTFTNVNVPIINQEHNLNDELDLTPNGGNNRGSNSSQTQIEIALASHPIISNAGFPNGILTTGVSGSGYVWGKPNLAGAQIVATSINDHNQAYIYTYDQGAPLVSGVTAPSRRAGFFLGNNTATSLNADGWKLFDETVHWAIGGSGSGNPNQAPVAGFTYEVPGEIPPFEVGASIDFTSTSTDPDGSIITYAWDFGDGNSSAGQTSTHAYTSSGNYTIRLNVTDDEGATDFHEISITIVEPSPSNQAPVATIILNPNPIIVGQGVTFDGTGSSDSDGNVVSYIWNWTDISPQTASGATTSAFFGVAGSYPITLTVTDDDGDSHSLTQILVVNDTLSTSPKEALVVVGSLPANAGDTELKNILESEGYTVNMISQENVGQFNLENQRFAIVSSSINTADPANALAGIEIPLIVMEYQIYDDLKFTQNGGANRGSISSQKSIYISDPTHPIVSNLALSGDTEVLQVGRGMAFGKPSASANIVASYGTTDQHYIFTYDPEEGDQLIDGTTPNGLRIAFCIGSSGYTRLTPTGRDLILGVIHHADPTDPIDYTPCWETGFVLANPSIDRNYILTQVPRVPIQNVSDIPLLTSKTEFQERISYLDGLGRPLQEIDIHSAPNCYDIITFHDYNQFGQEPVVHLPYMNYTAGGSYQANPIAGQQNFYSPIRFPEFGNDVNYAFSVTQFESSPLARVIEQGAPGQAWQPNIIDPASVGIHNSNEHTILQSYHFNDGDQVNNVEIIAKFTYDPVLDKFTRELPYGVNGTYEHHQLYVTETTDENGAITLEYKDKLGRLIVKQTEVDELSSKTDATSFANTYYLYDNKGNLRIVIQPEGMEQLWAPSWDLYTPGFLEKYAFQYKYDDKNRLIAKWIPGTEDWTRFILDPLGRIVLSQDPNMRTYNTLGELIKSDYHFIKYGEGGNPIITGRLRDNTSPGIRQSRDQLQAELDGFWDSGFYPLYEKVNTSGPFGYTDEAFPLSWWNSTEENTISYYDNYDAYSGGSFIPEPLIPNLINEISLRTRGKITGLKTRVFNPAPDMPAWMETWTFYTAKGEEAQTITENHLGGTDQVSYSYDFVGNLVHSVHRHTDDAATLTLQEEFFTYDHRGRLLRHEHQINSQPRVTLSENTYNEIGLLTEKKLHQALLQSEVQRLDYTYNIRGWMTAINDFTAASSKDLFAMKLRYNEDLLDIDWGGSTVQEGKALFNGNISGWEWRNPEQDFDTPDAYAFAYDKINRLRAANNGSSTNGGQGYTQKGTFRTSYEYDFNGNIERLVRYGDHNLDGSPDLIDDLAYTYSGNRLINITENSLIDNSGISIDLDHFQKLGNSFGQDEYTYDVNGNLISDFNGNFDISYNILNKPVSATRKSDGKYIGFHYSADGTKLRKTIFASGSNSSRIIDYVGGIHYEDTDGVNGPATKEIAFIQHAEGRLVPSGGIFQYQYTLKDHLGNTRVLFADANGDGTVNVNDPSELLQVIQGYYPFGLEQKGAQTLVPATDNSYKYSGKEQQADLNFDWYDFGARIHNPSLGRWNGVDALAEKYSDWSPYNYTLNNPIRFVDPDGNFVSTPRVLDIKVNVYAVEHTYTYTKYDPTPGGGSVERKVTMTSANPPAGAKIESTQTRLVGSQTIHLSYQVKDGNLHINSTKNGSKKEGAGSNVNVQAEPNALIKGDDQGTSADLLITGTVDASKTSMFPWDDGTVTVTMPLGGSGVSVEKNINYGEAIKANSETTEGGKFFQFTGSIQDGELVLDPEGSNGLMFFGSDGNIYIITITENFVEPSPQLDLLPPEEDSDNN